MVSLVMRNIRLITFLICLVAIALYYSSLDRKPLSESAGDSEEEHFDTITTKQAVPKKMDLEEKAKSQCLQKLKERATGLTPHSEVYELQMEQAVFVSRLVFDGEQVEKVYWTRLDEDGFPWPEELPAALQSKDLSQLRSWLSKQKILRKSKDGNYGDIQVSFENDQLTHVDSPSGEIPSACKRAFN